MVKNISATIRALLKQRGLCSKGKTKKVLEDEDGKPISAKLRGLLGLLSSGKMPQKLEDVPKSERKRIYAK